MAGIGVAVLGVAVVGGAVLLATGGGDGDESPSDTTGPETTALPQALTKEEAGLEARYPNGWKLSEQEGIVNLESPDRCVAVALSAPVPASDSARLFDDSISALRRTFGKIQTRPPTRAAVIGGAPTETALVAVRTKRGQPIVIQMSVSRGRELAHVAQIVIRDPRCSDSVKQSRKVLASIEYSR